MNFKNLINPKNSKSNTPMAKRFTDTDKWKKPFIRSLETPYKLLWFYILDDCDHAGIWQVDFAVAEIRIGCKVSESAAKQFFAEKIQVINGGSKWFIRDFIFFQYGELSEKNRLHLSVINILKRNEIDVNKPLRSPLEGVKDKYKDKDKEQDKDKEYVLWESVKTNFINAYEWKEKFCRDKNISMPQIEFKMLEFISDVELKEDYKDLKELKRHFTNWFNKHKNGTHKQASSGGSEKLGTSAARIKAARDF